MDLASLRALLRPHIEQLALLNRHVDLPALCEGLGLPVPSPDGSKRQRVLTSFDSAPDMILPRVVERYVDSYCGTASARNELQEALWKDSDVPGVSRRCRHDLARALWLHWDARTVKERGFQALTRLRMDFLLLLPFGVRVVVEVDGKHHYANDEGRADASKYAP